MVLHADVVSSTELVRRNEVLAHERMQDAFRRLSATIGSYGGRTHELRGDALLAEFPRVSDAVSAALVFQAENASYDVGQEDDLRVALRIGISLGEIVIADHTLTGPDVVLAQRLEQLAAPGGLCISQAAYQSMPRRLPFSYEDLGEQLVKGFDEPVRVYAVSLRPGHAAPEQEGPVLHGPARDGRRAPTWPVASLAALLVIAGVLLAWLRPWSDAGAPGVGTAPDTGKAPDATVADKPSIAVLPFDNLSADEQQEYFVDGMTEDLITDLSKVSGLFVIARNSSFVYKGRAVDVKQVGRELGVRYLLEGSVRRVGDVVRVNAQLVDTATGGHVWSERYDGTLEDVFELQDGVTRKIVSVLAVHLGVEDRERVGRQGTRDVKAYDEFLAGWHHYLRQTPEDFGKAIPHFERAVERDPEYGRAHAALAATYWYAAKRLWENALGMGAGHELRFEAESFLEKAMQHPTPLAHQVAADMLSLRQQYDAAIAEAEKAVALDPNDADSSVALASALTLAGRPGEALELVERGMSRNPHFPPHYLYELGMARFGLGHLDDAATAFERALALNPEDRFAQRLLLATYGLLGRQADAARLTETSMESDRRGRFGAVFDPLTVRASTYWVPFRRLADAERFAEGLRKAGLPD